MFTMKDDKMFKSLCHKVTEQTVFRTKKKVSRSDKSILIQTFIQCKNIFESPYTRVGIMSYLDLL